MESASPSTCKSENVVSQAPTATLFALDPTIAEYNVPLNAYLKAFPKLDGAAVGAIVFNEAGRMLLVQRAAHDSMPLRWEIPGGAIDAEDSTMLHAVARELWEEAGLRAHFVGELVGCYKFVTRRLGHWICKFSFMVDVEDYDVKLDPNEHQAYVWATEDEARAKRCGDLMLEYTTKDQEDTILKAFSIKREKKST